VALVGGFAGMAVLWARAERSAVASRRLAATEATASAKVREQSRLANARAEELAWHDYVGCVNRAYLEIQDDNIGLVEELLRGCPPERRGWDWHHVERLAHLERLTLRAGGPSVEAVAFSQDGTWMASASGVASYNTVYSGAGDAEVATWDVATGRKGRTFAGLPGIPHDLAISPDGTKIVASSGTFTLATEGWLVAWDTDTATATGRPCWSRNEPGRHAMCLDFHPHNGLLAVGYGLYASTNTNGLIKLWDPASGCETRTFIGPRDGVQALAFHPDGRRLAAAGSGVVDFWDLDAGVKVREFRGHDSWVFAVAFSPDGHWMATGGWDRTIKLWDLDSGSGSGVERRTLFGHKGFVLSLGFSPDGKHLTSTSEDQSAKLWEVATGREAAVFDGHEDFVQCAAFRPDGRELATGGVDGELKLWDLMASRPIVFDRHHAAIFHLAIRHDGRRVRSSSIPDPAPEPQVRVWDPVTGTEDPDPALDDALQAELGLDFLPGPDGNITTVQSGDGRLVAHAVGKPTRARSGAGGHGGTVAEIRDTTNLRLLSTLIGHTGDIVCLGFSPDGRLATASDDRTIKRWDTATGREVFTLRGHTGALRCLVFSPDGNRIITGAVDGTARVWDGNPLPSTLLQECESRHRRKAEVVERSRRAEEPAQWIDLNAAIGHWDRVVAAARAVEKEPDDLMLRWKQLVGLVRLGDRDRLRRTREEELRHFSGTRDHRTALAVLWHCNFTPDLVPDPDALVRVAEDTLRVVPQRDRGNALRILALTLYRAGRFEEAIAHQEESTRAGQANRPGLLPHGDGPSPPRAPRRGPPLARSRARREAEGCGRLLAATPVRRGRGPDPRQGEAGRRSTVGGWVPGALKLGSPAHWGVEDSAPSAATSGIAA
jgi:WD40 repeat protein